MSRPCRNWWLVLLFLAVSLVLGCRGIDRTARSHSHSVEIIARKPIAGPSRRCREARVEGSCTTFYAHATASPPGGRRHVDGLPGARSSSHCARAWLRGRRLRRTAIAARLESLLQQSTPDAPSRARQTRRHRRAPDGRASGVWPRRFDRPDGRAVCGQEEIRTRRGPRVWRRRWRTAVDDPKAWVDSIRPPHPDTRRSRRALVSLQGQREKKEWPVGAEVSRQDSEPVTIALRRRLAAGGHLSAEAASNPSPVFSESDRSRRSGVSGIFMDSRRPASWTQRRWQR